MEYHNWRQVSRGIPDMPPLLRDVSLIIPNAKTRLAIRTSGADECLRPPTICRTAILQNYTRKGGRMAGISTAPYPESKFFNKRIAFTNISAMFRRISLFICHLLHPRFSF
jgi:hypothetical protein